MDSRKILRNIMDNWPAKVLSIVLAIVFYLFHQIGTLGERYLSIPLRIDTASDLIPVGVYDHIMRVTVRGEPNSIYLITEQDIEVYADLKNYPIEGEYKVPIKYRKRGNAAGVSPLEIKVDPLEITVFLEQRQKP